MLMHPFIILLLRVLYVVYHILSIAKTMCVNTKATMATTITPETRIAIITVITA